MILTTLTKVPQVFKVLSIAIDLLSPLLFSIALFSSNLHDPILGFLAGCISVLVCSRFQLYTSLRHLSLQALFLRIFSAYLCWLFLCFYILAPQAFFSAPVFLLFTLILFALISNHIVLRLFSRTVKRHWAKPRRFILVAAKSSDCDTLLSSLRLKGIEIKTLLVLSPNSPSPDPLCNYEQLHFSSSSLQSLPTDAIYLVNSFSLTSNDVTSIVNSLSLNGAPFFFLNPLHHLSIPACYCSVFGIPAISIAQHMNRIDLRFKQFCDIIFAIMLLTLLSPLLLFVVLLVRASSPGPIIYKQYRYGFKNHPFTLYKFRTMYTSTGNSHFSQAQSLDPRITNIGRFLRKTSLDELPQLINVIQGHMSIVGPRPHALEHHDIHSSSIPAYPLRHILKPGITGLAQIRGYRGPDMPNNSLKLRLYHDLEYIRDWSIRLDLAILLKTPLSMLLGKNAV